MKNTGRRLYEVISFCIVGAVTFVVDYGLLYFCTEYLNVGYFYSAAFSFSIAVIINYFLCVRYVFTHTLPQTTMQAVLFIGSSIIGLGINQICMWFLVEKVGMYYMIAKIVATAIVTLWNYVMKRKAISA